jgi:AraC-like DNA-binding protein
MRAQGSVSALLVQPLVAALSASPPLVDTFFRTTNLTPELLTDPDARISPSQFSLAWTGGIRLSGDPRLALGIAASIPPGAFGLVEYVCRTTPTLGEALRQWVRYLNILNDSVKVALIEDGDVVAVRVVADSDPAAPSSHELCFAVLAKRVGEITSPSVAPTLAEFTHRVEGSADYERWFSAPVRFGARATQLLFPRSALCEKLVTADPMLLGILQRLAEDLSEKTPDLPPLTAQVRRAVGTALQSDGASIERVAQSLGLTARSLQRRLKEEGTSFQAVREQVRQELAQRYLGEGLAITEISFLLGFSEPSAFFRAFKRWTGTTPLESRARLTGRN